MPLSHLPNGSKLVIAKWLKEALMVDHKKHLTCLISTINDDWLEFIRLHETALQRWTKNLEKEIVYDNRLYELGTSIEVYGIDDKWQAHNKAAHDYILIALINIFDFKTSLICTFSFFLIN